MIYFAADLHLRQCIWKGHPEIKGDQYMAWAELCRTVSDDPDGALVLAGDVFDTPYPSGMTEYAFCRGMEMLKSSGRPCWFIPGNHDNEDLPRPMLFGAELLDSPQTICGLAVSGIPFTRSSTELHAGIEALPPLDALVLHTGFRHLLGFNETWQLSAEDIPDSVGKVFSGHVHAHSEEGKVYSPGSLALHRADEIDKGHGFFMMDPSTGEVAWREVRTRTFVSVDIGEGFGLDSLGPLADRSERETPVVLLNYQNSDTSLADDLVEKYAGRLFFVRNARAAERAQVVEDTAASSFDPAAVAREYLSQSLDDEQRGLAEELMTTTDPSAVISRLTEHA